MALSVILSWLTRSGDSLPGLLAEDVIFSSPVADYHGRADAAHVLGLIACVVENVAPTAWWGNEDDAIQAFDAQVGGADIEGLLRERRDGSGELAHVTLYLRPYRTLGVAIGRMGDLLAESPLPSVAG